MRVNMLRGWNKAHAALNKPSLVAIPPFNTWSLPDGFTYREEYDRIQDDDGNVLEPDSSMYGEVCQSIEFVPRQNSPELRQLLAAGMIKAGSIDVSIKSTDLEALKEAWAVEVEGTRYLFRSADALPDGGLQIAHVRLEVK